MKEREPALRDEPWLMRTYSGYASARASNALFRTNLAKGQTGLSIAFDLPTQTGYDSDHGLARGEVGKLGVPMRSLADMETLFDADPDRAHEHLHDHQRPGGLDLGALPVGGPPGRGPTWRNCGEPPRTTSSRSTLSRGTYIFPPKASMRLAAEVIRYTFHRIPRWNPINICSYHLQESGADPVQELAYRPGQRHIRPGRGPGRRRHRAGRFPTGGRAHVVFPQCGYPVHRGDVQGARVLPHVGPHLPGTLRGGGPRPAALPLRGPGQQPGADATPAGEQHRPHHLRVSGRRC